MWWLISSRSIRGTKPLQYILSKIQADLSLRWAHRSFCWFCHAKAHTQTVTVQTSLSLELWTFCVMRLKYDPQHDKAYIITACAVAQFDQSLCFPLYGKLRNQSFFTRTAKTLKSDCTESSLGAHVISKVLLCAGMVTTFPKYFSGLRPKPCLRNICN